MRRMLMLAPVLAVAALEGCDRPLPVPHPVTLWTPVDGALLTEPGVEFSWSSGGFHEWLFELGMDGDFDDPLRRDTIMIDEDDVIAWSATVVKDGEYCWRVRARSEDGVWGTWSAVREFTLERFEVVAVVPTPGYAQAIAVAGDRVYIADGQAGLAVFDVSDPESPQYLGSVMDSLNEAYGVAVQGRYAYLAYGYKELMVVDVSNPDSLAIAGELEYPQPGYGYDIVWRDSVALIAADAQFIAVEVDDPAHPDLRFQYRYPRGLRGIAVRDSWCFLALEQLGVAVWNVSTLPPVAVGSFDTPSNARDVAVAGDYLYVADGRAGLLVADVSDPGQPVVAAALELSGYVQQVSVHGTRLYAGCGSDGVCVVDVSDPSAPVVIAEIETGYARAALEHDGYVFVCDRDLGLAVIQIKEQE